MLRARGYIGPEVAVTVLPNGVSDEWFEAESPERLAPTRAPVFLFVGRMDSQKGLDILLRAIRLVADVSLRIVGTGWREKEYRALVEQLGIGERTQFLGQLLPNGVRREMQRAAALILPSRAELFGIVLAEAMATGIPTIASSVGGIPEVVQHGLTGLLVPPNDVGALAGAIDTLAHDGELRARLGRAGRVTARSWRWETLGRRTVEEMELARQLSLR